MTLLPRKLYPVAGYTLACVGSETRVAIYHWLAACLQFRRGLVYAQSAAGGGDATPERDKVDHTPSHGYIFLRPRRVAGTDRRLRASVTKGTMIF